MYLPREIFILLPLLGNMFHLVRELEQDDARLSTVYPLVTELLSSLRDEAGNVDACIGLC
jgi:hypothetical protein